MILKKHYGRFFKLTCDTITKRAPLFQNRCRRNYQRRQMAKRKDFRCKQINVFIFISTLLNFSWHLLHLEAFQYGIVNGIEILYKVFSNMYLLGKGRANIPRKYNNVHYTPSVHQKKIATTASIKSGFVLREENQFLLMTCSTQ